MNKAVKMYGNRDMVKSSSARLKLALARLEEYRILYPEIFWRDIELKGFEETEK